MENTVKDDVSETLMQSLDNHTSRVLARAAILENRVRELNSDLFNYEESSTNEEGITFSLEGILHIRLESIEDMISNAMKLLNKI